MKKSLTIARDYARNPRGWLVFSGGYGCGKTHLAAAIANYRVYNGYPAIFVVVPDLLDHLRAAFGPSSTVGLDRRLEEIRRAPLLVLDDLGTQSATPWAQEKLFQIFDYRYNARLPTVITITQDVELDPRLKTRILDVSACQVLAITAPSYRGTQRLRASARGGEKGPCPDDGETRTQRPAGSTRGRTGLGVSG
ncbi:MAG: ATP-binding protein [Chloroflexi bacterium]|nr:ATP-binding protein [Chloroflexota bacterium]